MVIHPLRECYVIGVILLLLSLTGLPCVEGDGIPITYFDVYATLRENRQLAYIEVDGDSEKMELFINVISLHPGENLTVIVPLRTVPTSFTAHPTNDVDFRKEHNMDHLINLGKRQNEGFTSVKDEIFGDAGVIIGSMVLIGGVPVFLSASALHFSRDNGHYDERVYEEQGFSVDLVTFHSSPSMNEYFQDVNLSVPDNIWETMERYGNFSIAVINLTTRPPIDEEDYGELLNAAPSAMEEFRKFVENNPRIKVPGHPPIEYFTCYDDYSELCSLYFRFRDELDTWAQRNNVSEEKRFEMRRNFNILAATTYGYGKMDGYTLSFELPLHGDNAFFPLGTTSSWNGTDVVEVVFECDDEHGIDFNVDPKYEVLEEGRHYYIWNYKGIAPDHDVEGTYHSENTAWKRLEYRVNEPLYDHATPMAFLLLIILYISGVIGISFISHRSFHEKVTLQEVFAHSLYIVTLSLICPLSVAILLGYLSVMNKHRFSDTFEKVCALEAFRDLPRWKQLHLLAKQMPLRKRALIYFVFVLLLTSMIWPYAISGTIKLIAGNPMHMSIYWLMFYYFMWVGGTCIALVLTWMYHRSMLHTMDHLLERNLKAGAEQYRSVDPP